MGKAGSVMRYEYDENYNMRKQSNPDGGIFVYDYDETVQLRK